MNQNTFKALLKSKKVDEDSGFEVVTLKFKHGATYLTVYGWADEDFELQIEECGYSFNGKWVNVLLRDEQKELLKEMIIEEANNFFNLKQDEEKEEYMEDFHPYNYATRTLSNRI